MINSIIAFLLQPRLSLPAIIPGLFLLLPLAINTFTAEPPDSSTHTPSPPPEEITTQPSPVYVDEASVETDSSGTRLRIQGHLPTPCHFLNPPEARIDNDTLYINLSSWHKSGRTCVQVLEPFVYYYTISGPGESGPVAIRLNQKLVPH